MLINWASTSLEKSVNQPTLPHAVIALNATETKVDQQEWDPMRATNWLMSSVAGAVDRDPNFRQLAQEWTERGKRIRTTKDLLECFYSSVTVVRIPGEGRYMMIDDQITKLHDIITKRCAESFNAKRRSRMLSNSETLNVYLQCAYDHFSQDLHKPFNFMDISFQISPIPLDFGGNILKLAVAMKSRYGDPIKIFKELSFMVSSCILLDCVRQDWKGKHCPVDAWSHPSTTLCFELSGNVFYLLRGTGADLRKAIPRLLRQRSRRLLRNILAMHFSQSTRGAMCQCQRTTY